MRLHRHQIPGLARKVVKALTDAGDIETADPREVERDIEAVLANYLDQVDQTLSRARDLSQQRGLVPGDFARIKTLAADQAGIKIGNDALDFVLDQLVEMLLSSANVEEVFAADHDLRARMRPFILADAELDKEVDEQVRGKLKHVTEGSRTWEIEYQRIREEIRRRRGN